MKLEKNIQKRFVDIVTNRVHVSNPSSAHRVYANLIFYRLKEIFEKSFPRFIKLLSEERFNELVYDFIKQGAKTPTLWKVSEEFKEFILQNNNFEIDYLEDLLEFEYLELFMHMQNYSQINKRNFALENTYKLSALTKIVALKYPVHHPRFDIEPSSFSQGEFFILVYHKEKTNEIIYEEITPFIYEFLHLISPTRTLNEILQVIAYKYEIKVEEILEVLRSSLEHYIDVRILI